MEKIKPGMFYIAADGDGIGKLVGRAILANDVEELHSVSNRIDAAQDFILHWCDQVGGIKISGGGDEFSAAIDKEALKEIEGLRSSIEKAFGYTISVGVGRNLAEAGTALLVAKLRGKDRIVYFNKKIKEDIKKAKRRVREKRASVDENKLAEAYLTKAEPMLCTLHKKETHKKHLHILHKHEEGFHNSVEAKEGKLPLNPDNEDNRTDDCAYCQDLDAQENADGTAGMHDCDACKEYDADKQITGGIDTDNCPYCQEDDALHNSNPDNCPMCDEYNAAQGTKDLENITGAQDHPESEQDHICNCPNCGSNKNDQTALGVEDMAAQRPDDCPQCQEIYGDAIENQPDQTGQEDPNLQGHETAEEVLDLLDQEPGKGEQTPAQAAKKIDNTELPQGDAMEEGTSVTEDFGPKQKADVSDPEKELQESGEGHGCNCPKCPQQSEQNESELGQDTAELGQESGQVEEGQDEPDMAGVLQSGLDEHADEQNKARVVDMVAQTLQGFKSNKEPLEAMKEQSPGVYNSTIQMLKAMIELCKLLGLEPKMSEQAPTEAVPQQAPTSPKEASPRTAPQGESVDPKAAG